MGISVSSAMKVSLVRGRELSDDILCAWHRLRQANPDLTSPYFHPEFTRIIASRRNDVEIAVLESGGEIVGLFPFHRERGSIGRPWASSRTIRASSAHRISAAIRANSCEHAASRRGTSTTCSSRKSPSRRSMTRSSSHRSSIFRTGSRHIIATRNRHSLSRFATSSGTSARCDM